MPPRFYHATTICPKIEKYRALTPAISIVLITEAHPAPHIHYDRKMNFLLKQNTAGFKPRLLEEKR